MSIYLDHITVEAFADNSRIVATVTGYFGGGETDEEVRLGTLELTLAQWDALGEWARQLALVEDASDEPDTGPIRLESL